MNKDISIRPSEIHDSEFLGPLLRPIDKTEIYCASFMYPTEALAKAYNSCEICNTAVYKGTPVAMFGVNRVSWGGIPWLLGTQALDKVMISYAKISREWVRVMLGEYGFLRNFVHAENDKSIRWLRDCLNFNIGKAPTIINNHPFLMFEKGEQRV